jgi:hypothetical protein
METIISLMPNDEHLTAARQELEKAGFAKNKINILYQPADVWQQLGGHQKKRLVFNWAAAGALVGLVIGALYGLPAGIFNCFFMDCPVRTSLILWAIISLFWVVAGGIVGAIIGLDKLEDDLYSYVEGVRRGEALFVVEARQEQAQQAIEILRQEHGTVIHDIQQEKEIK